MQAQKDNRYTKYTPEQRRKRIQDISNAKKRRLNGNGPIIRRRRVNWLSKAQVSSYEDEGNLYELNKVSYCVYCAAKKFEYEPPTFCCSNGKIKLASTHIPQELCILFTSQSDEAKHLQNNIRAYNSIFSFTSFGVTLDKDLASSRHGVYTFRAQGQIYHDLPALIPEEGNPRFFQLYFYDTENELQNRMRIMQNANLDESIMKKLMKILKVNPYAQFLRRLKDQPSFDNLEIRIATNIGLDQRVYNSPSADQVAAIWVEGNNPNVELERQIVVHAHSGHRHRVKHYFGCYDPLQYPLLFPKGEIRWHQNIKKYDPINNNSSVPTFTSVEDIFERELEGVNPENPENISCREYYCYKLQIREHEESMLLFAGRLFQQYAVDMYIKLETTRLDYYRREQSEMRAELYQGIVDSVMAGENRGDQVGKRIVLPASFIGGPRDMRRRYMDAMALVQKFGKPDLFITMTCNPEWKEIKEQLKEGQRVQDRPDLTARIFRAKLKDLKDQLFKKEIFGKVAARVHVIEFQKRGLPHAHMLIILQPGYKILSPDQYNKFVSAEIPDKNENPILYELVAKHMMHGPCGDHNKENSCMVNGKCKFHYPRPFCSKTMHDRDSYPIYRRRKDNREVRARNVTLDNQWVVPYNPYLLTRYNCHINVEICSGLKAVKYLYKYIYKGHDRVAVYIAYNEGDNIIDEIQQFQDARWVSAQEAMWRIFEFKLNEIYPAVINLQLHLPNKQYVTYWKNKNLEHVIQWEHISRTMLTEYFKKCSIDDDAERLLYREFPEYYVWDSKGKVWSKRKKGEVIGRINGANPIEGERYYLRLLLNHVRGPKSFDDLLNVDGVQYFTFKEAAEKRGLLESDLSVLECLNEAVTFKMPQALRRLFATILVYCEPVGVRKLWDLYFDAMSEDFKRIYKDSIYAQIQYTLKGINFFLESMGKDIKKYDLPAIEIDISTFDISNSREIAEELDVEIPPEDYDASSRLNPEQEVAYKTILDRVTSGRSGVFFVDGPGGTGKTYLYRALLANVRSRGMIALATATSGVAAAIMPGGRTAHSRFKIPIITTESSMCNISKQSGTAELLRRAKLIIWDEAPMAKRFAIETVDRSLKDIIGCSEPFGGKVIVFAGDFRQVLPVVPRATRQQTVNASLVKSYLWHKMEKLRLTRNMRARTDKIFGDFLLRVGNGEEPTTDDDMIVLPDEMVIKHGDDDSSKNALINSIFPSLEKHAASAEYMTKRAILATTNEYVDQLNEKLIAMFPGESRIFNSFDKAEDDTHNYYQEEFLNTLLPNGLPPHKLMLKKNCPIILLRNLDPSNGLCNGTRMVCRGFGGNVIHAEITIGQHAGKQVLLPRIPLSPAENEGYPFIFKRKQFPIRLSFAMTINKAQGQTIQNVGVYLPQHVFSHGQLYVALSRGISMSTTKVFAKSDNSNKRKGTYTKNVVYKEVLLS